MENDIRDTVLAELDDLLRQWSSLSHGRRLGDTARIAGFQIDDVLHLQLRKSNPNARPRSLDDYYESLLILRKPAA